MAGVDQKRSPGHIGDFYNHLGASLIGGEMSGDVHDGSRPLFSDVYNSRLKIFLEAKGAGNGNAWKLSESQLKQYVSNGKTYLYLLGSYKSDRRYGVEEKRPKGIKSSHRSVLPTLKTKAAKFNFLAEATDEIHLFDLSFMQRIHKAGVGVTREEAFGRESYKTNSHFQLRRRDVRQFIGGSDEVLMSLGILPGEWVFRILQITKRFVVRPQEDLFGKRYEYPVAATFPLYTVLSPSLDKKLIREIERNDDRDMPF